ncbi:type VI secretion system protein TssA [Methyloglobulus sp.]|uniref:type VI secretion system protein TssA n=1 Tax=Methyloglobulus sp. TaxID=2518622 RepID=UPI003989428A
MSNFTLDHFLVDISPDSPCGKNLEQDHAFAQLENDAKFIPERQMGDVIIPEKAPDWKKVRDSALTLLDCSRDIQVAMYLTCGLVQTDGFRGLDNGLTLIKGLLQKHWDDVYPCQDPEDDYPVLRMNTLATLDDDKKIIEPLLNLPLTKSRLGEFSWNLIEASKSKVEALSHMSQEGYVESLKKSLNKDAPGTLEEAKIKASAYLDSIEAAFNETDLQNLRDLGNTIKHALEQAEAILAISSDKAGPENAPDISRFIKLFKNLQKLFDEKIKLKEALALEQGESEAVRLDVLAMTDITQRGVKAVKSNGIQSREDVIFAIDGICKYFEHYEPSSPVPFLLQRAKKLLSMNFMEILQDLTPDAVSQAENICGTQQKKT